MSKEQISQAQYEKNIQATLFTVLKDLNESGSKDSEAMWLIGSLATKMIEDSKAKDWPELKLTISPKGFDLTISELQKQIIELQASGKKKAAYAMQAIAVSLTSERIKDEDTVQGNELLNQLIANAIAYFNQVNNKSKLN
ncbi:MAG: hypothetical protein L3J15_06090 [Devosiaceae bacterium]|nr:hypothetical protein [Devosiaceae bacterium]